MPSVVLAEPLRVVCANVTYRFGRWRQPVGFRRRVS
jgi:hypothetical protein